MLPFYLLIVFIDSYPYVYGGFLNLFAWTVSNLLMFKSMISQCADALVSLQGLILSMVVQ